MATPALSRKAAEGLALQGYHDISELSDADPVDIYERLTNRTDFYAEPCMLNMLRIAVKMAEKA